MKKKNDFLAITYLLGGSSFGRSKTREGAVENCVKSLKDWSHLINFKESNVVIHIWELHKDSGITDEITWDSGGLSATDKSAEKGYRLLDKNSCYAGAVRFKAPVYKGRLEGPNSKSRKFWSDMVLIAKVVKPVKLAERTDNE